MSSLIDEQQVWPDSSGAPIVNGYIHIGTQNTDPTLTPNKITIYSDRDLSVPLSNPQRTDSNGRSVNKIWVPGRYSITVQDSASAQKYSELDAGQSAQTGISNLTNIQGVDTITADGSPTITALIDQEIFTFRAIGTVTGVSTLKIDTTPTWPVKKYHDQALVSGDIEINQVVSVMWNETDSVYELQSSTAAHNFPTTVKFSKGADITSASALTLGNDGNYFDVTGTTNITSIDAVGIGTVIKLHFDGVLTLTHNATNLVLPGGADIVTVAGDEIEFIEYATGDWRLTSYSKIADLIISGNVRAGNVQVNKGELTINEFDIDNDVIENAWETVGPTGSGATNIWTGIDDLPNNATVLLVNMKLSVTSAASGSQGISVYAASGDASSPVDSENNIIGNLFRVAGAGSEILENKTSSIMIPLGAGSIFKIKWSATNDSARKAGLFYKGFITD